MSVARLLRFSLLLIPPPLSALAQKQPDRIYTAQQIPEGCDRAEREQLPICFFYCGESVTTGDAAAFDRMWRDALEKMSGECVVIAARHPEKGSEGFGGLRLRALAGSLAMEALGATLVDPWQEEKLGEAKAEKPSTAFTKAVGELEKKAEAWKTEHAPKPEQWTDGKGRSLTAAALAWDGKTATFRLQNGKKATLDAAALSAETTERLSKAYRPKLPFVNAADEAALAAAVGKEVCVVGRVKDGGPISGSIGLVDAKDTDKVYYINFSSVFMVTYKKPILEVFGKMRPTVSHQTRGRAYGVLEKDRDLKGKYSIRVTDPRQYGPGAAPE